MCVIIYIYICIHTHVYIYIYISCAARHLEPGLLAVEVSLILVHLAGMCIPMLYYSILYYTII